MFPSRRNYYRATSIARILLLSRLLPHISGKYLNNMFYTSTKPLFISIQDMIPISLGNGCCAVRVCTGLAILTTNLAACVCVCVCAKFDQFLPARSYFKSKRSENFVRIAKFPYAAFGPLLAFHCPLFFLRETVIRNENRHASP